MITWYLYDWLILYKNSTNEESITGGFMKSKERIKENKVYLTIKLPYGEQVDADQIKALTQRCNHGFFNVSKYTRNKIELFCPIGNSLNQRLNQPISKFDFLLIVEQFLYIIQKIQSMRMDINNLLLDLNYIYFNEYAKELSFVYLPIVNHKEQIDIINFIESLIYLVKPEDPNDASYLFEFNYYLKKINRNDLQEIERFIYRQNNQIIRLVKKENEINVSAFEEVKTKKHFEKTELMELDNSLNQIDESEEKTVLLGDLNKPINKVSNESASFNYPKLVRLSTNEIIVIDKPVFRIGKEKQCVDFVVTNNATISRSHADIISKNGRYYVFDIQSKNRTYINNRVLPSEKEIEISNDDVLKLANEEFLFKTQ